MLTSLPSFCKGLKLVRLGAILLLLQIAMSIVMTFKAFGSHTLDEARDMLHWSEYVMLANGIATLAMCIGATRSIPELARARFDIRGVVIAAVGFAIATVAIAWSYHAITSFVDVALNPRSSLDDIMTASERLSSLKTVASIKDIAYAAALVSMIRTVQRSAIVNDQLALRDEAGSMSRALVVMLVADVFYQLTYGLGSGSVGIVGAIGALIIAVYWIYCHVRLVRFLANAAYFVNEPHDLPVATALRVSPEREARPAPAPRARTSPVPRASTATPRPQPVVTPPASTPRPQPVVTSPAPPPRPLPVAVPPAPPPPRPVSATDASTADDAPSSEPRFLR